MQIEKKMASIKQKIKLLAKLPRPYSSFRKHTFSMDPNLKMSAILFVLHYVRYRGRLKSRIWVSKVHHCLLCQVDH